MLGITEFICYKLTKEHIDTRGYAPPRVDTPTMMQQEHQRQEISEEDLPDVYVEIPLKRSH